MATSFLRAVARDLAAQHGLGSVVYGLEPTGVYHKPLLEYPVRAGEQALLVANVADPVGQARTPAWR